MPDPILMAKAMLFAAVGAAAVAVLVGRFQRSGGAPGVGFGALVGVWTLGLLPMFPPREALDRLLMIVLPAALLAEVVAAGRAVWVGWAGRVGVAVLATPVLVEGSSYVTDLTGPGSREWSPEYAAIIFAGLAAVLVLEWVALSRLAVRADRSAPVAVAVAAGGAAVTVMLSGYATGGQLGLPLAAAVVAIAAVGGRHSAGAVGLGVVGLFGLLVVGSLFAGLTVRNGAALFLAPLFAWLPELPRLRLLRPQIRGVLRVSLTALPVIVTLIFAQQKFATDSAGPSDAPNEPSLNDYLEYGK